MKLAVAALCLWGVTVGLFLVGTAGHALHNGDEAIYAEMAREMRSSGDWSTLRWQREPQFPRPPLTVWLLAAVGPEHLRILLALVSGLELALVLVLGVLWFGWWAGAAAAGVLLGSDLFLGYTRYFESEPFLCVMVLASFLCWEKRRFVGWGVFLGLALMVKQLVGGLPLLALLLDRRREAWRGVVAALVVWLPWHVYAAMQHGGVFLDSYFLQNVLARSTGAMLQTTRWTFYFRELWRSEGPFVLLFAGTLVATLLRARRSLPHRLVAVWALVVLGVYTLARSRYDYYLLLAYPAFALACGAALSQLPRLREVTIIAVVAVMLALHLPRNLGHFGGEDEQRALVQIVNQRHPSRLYLYNTHAYAARYYSDVDVTTLLESDDDLRAAKELQKAGMPSSVAPAPDLRASLAALPRPWALLMPRARASLLPEGLLLAGETQHYLLLEMR